MARTLEEQTNSLAAYLPLGKLWGAKNQEGTITRGLLEGLSGELIRNSALLAEYREEILPDRTVLFLSEWERALGIPDDCFTGIGTDDERRNDILAKLASLGVQSAEDMRILALQVYGVDITIRNPTRSEDYVFPYTFHPTGEADPGDGGSFIFNLSDREARFQIIVEYHNLPTAVIFPYTFPLSFGSREANIIECLLTKLRPANVGFTQEILIGTETPVPPSIPPESEPNQEVLNAYSIYFDDPGDEMIGCRTVNYETGVNHNFGIPHASTKALSVAMWVKWRVAETANLFYLEQDPATSSNLIALGHFDTGKFFVRLVSGTDGNRQFHNGDFTATLNEWVHVVFTFDGSGVGGTEIYHGGGVGHARSHRPRRRSIYLDSTGLGWIHWWRFSRHQRQGSEAQHPFRCDVGRRAKCRRSG